MGSRNLEWAEYNRRSSVRLHPLFVGSPTYLKLQNTHVCRTQNCRTCRPSDGTLDDVGNVYSRLPRSVTPVYYILIHSSLLASIVE